MLRRRTLVTTGAASLAAGWQRHPALSDIPKSALAGMILGPGPAGHCDDARVGVGVPRWNATRREWQMWYYARDTAFTKDAPQELGTGYVALATSRDGLHWTRYQGEGPGGAVFAPSNNPADFNSLHIGLADVTFARGAYWMWYFGGDHTPSVDQRGNSNFGFRMLPGVARSTDGIHWTRLRGPGPRGATLDYGDDLYVGWGNAVHDGDKFIIYYTGVPKAFYPFKTYCAFSEDGVTWRPQGPITWADGRREWDGNGELTRHVIPNPLGSGPRWLMIYSGIDANPARQNMRSTCAAVSDDGLSWRHLYDAPIFTGGAPGSWDEHGTSGGQLIPYGKSLRLYYMGLPSHDRPDLPKGIGLAISQTGDLRRFQRYVS